MIKNVFITGKPGCGKTSLIIETVKELNFKTGGFYTREIREKNERKGFEIITLSGEKAILAHRDIKKSKYRVGRYKVDIQNLERIGVDSILDCLYDNDTEVIIIDEIGKMELFSFKFKKAVLAALKSKKKVLGTITLSPNSFCNLVKKREDTKILNLTKKNREEIKQKIIKLLEAR